MEAGRISSRGRGGDAREWDEEGYRRSILLERELSYRIVFRTAFAPSENPNPEIVLVASSDGSISAYSISSCISSCPRPMLCSKEVDQKAAPDVLSAGPLCSIQAHKGPSYDLKIYGNDEEALLLSCGDDGCIRGWKWADVHMAAVQGSNKGEKLSPILELVNPQKEGPWGALSPIPENNAIAVDKEDGSIFSAAGDSCAYWWDVETGKRKVVFKGHSDYLHSVVRKSSNQIITGSEDGTARVWDCRSGRCAQVINPQKSCKLKESSWISSVALDKSESWLVCGTGRGLSAWSLISYECIFSYDSHVPIQDVLFHDNQILAVGSEPVLRCFSINGKILSQIQCAPCSAFSISVHPSGVTAIGGYGGLVDVISEFGSHLCIFCCKTADSVWKI